MKFLDAQHPFFKPLWRRVLTVVAPAAWALVEFANGQTGWAIVFFAAAAYSGYELFLAPKPAPDTRPLEEGEDTVADDKTDKVER